MKPSQEKEAQPLFNYRKFYWV